MVENTTGQSEEAHREPAPGKRRTDNLQVLWQTLQEQTLALQPHQFNS